MLLRLWRQRKYAYLRRIMRGNARCRRSVGFETMRNLKSGLIDVNVASLSPMESWFFGTFSKDAEIAIRQFVFDRYGGSRLTYALFEYFGCKIPVKMAMPKTWRNYFKFNELPVNNFFSAIAWQVEIGLRYLNGILEIGRLCLKQIKGCKSGANLGQYVYLSGLSPSNLPPHFASEHNYDICNWYAQWNDKISGISSIVHDVKGETPREIYSFKVCFAPPPYEFPMDWNRRLIFLLWSVAAIIWAGLNILVGRWHCALVLGEAAKANAFRQIKSDRIASQYLFHASRTIYRPLWTYEAEKMGAQVALYFYSTIAQPTLQSGPVSQKFEWGPNTWPKFIVWDDYQEVRVRRDLGYSMTIQKAGPIFFSDLGDSLGNLPNNSIAVFDIQPHRLSSHLGFSTLADCLAEHPDFYHRFLREVIEVLLDCGANVALKAKRDIDSRGDRRYGQLLKEFEHRAGVRFINPAVSAMRLSMSCVASISAPFTSAALYAKKVEIPSVYYDPVRWMQRNDEAAHGVPVLFGKNELRIWVNEILNGKLKNSEILNPTF